MTKPAVSSRVLALSGTNTNTRLPIFADAHLDDRNRSDRKLAAPRAAPRSASHSIELVQTRHPWHPGLGCRKGYPRFGTFHEEAEGGDDDLDDPDEDDGLYQDGDIYYPSADEGEDAKEGEMGHEADGGESAPYEHDWVTLQQAFHAFCKGQGHGTSPRKRTWPWRTICVFWYSRGYKWASEDGSLQELRSYEPLGRRPRVP